MQKQEKDHMILVVAVLFTVLIVAIGFVLLSAANNKPTPNYRFKEYSLEELDDVLNKYEKERPDSYTN